MRADEEQTVVQEWETPSLEEIPVISRKDVQAMEGSNQDQVWMPGGMRHVVLQTVGRRSGKEHKVALPFWLDPQGEAVVVASFAGATNHPSWYLNLADRDANPDVGVRTQTGQYRCVPEILDGEEYERIWGLLTADRAWYKDYQAKTSRRIPLVRLPGVT